LNEEYSEINFIAIYSAAEFRAAVTANGYSAPRADQYNAFIKRMPDGGITTKQEASMFLAQILWESGGLKYKRELACVKTGCPGRYDHSVGVPGKEYYGRGYIQLTHSTNYKKASEALYHDDRLVKNPDLVADDEDAAWGTAFWYWKTFCHSRAGIAQGHFGVGTMCINGGECTHNMSAAHSRFAIYRKILAAIHLNVAANESGCYK
jgi:predicted chitinase